jgi:hypothetical protein
MLSILLSSLPNEYRGSRTAASAVMLVAGQCAVNTVDFS